MNRPPAYNRAPAATADPPRAPFPSARPMRAVFLDVPQSLLDERRRTGADQRDEVWNGVWHLVPDPTVGHQDLEGAVEAWLRRYWAPKSGGRVYHQINVAPADLADWRHDYRIPDLVLLTPERAGIERGTHFAGGPDAVVEIRSPGDETYDKIPFYAAVGVREVWVVDRDTRACEVHAIDATGVRMLTPARGGWITSALGVELRAEPDRRLALRLAGRPRSVGRVP